MDSPCVDCKVSTPAKCLAIRWPDTIPCENSKRALEYCEGCDMFFVWTDLPDESIKTIRESRGEFWGAPCSEEIVAGWECPSCGHYNDI